MSISGEVRALAWRWGPALAVMAGIFFFSGLPKQDVPDFAGWDFVVKKGGHLAGYALLGAMLLRGLAWGRPANWRLAAGALALAALYAASDEFHQGFVAGRGASGLDVMIDALGAIAGVGGWAKFGPRGES